MNFVVRIEKRRTKILKTVAKRKVVYNSTRYYLYYTHVDSCFTCDGSPTIEAFPLIFNIGMVI